MSAVWGSYCFRLNSGEWQRVLPNTGKRVKRGEPSLQLKRGDLTCALVRARVEQLEGRRIHAQR
eukprot:9466646-Pyramimonas_sp.AAC.1